MGKIKKFLYQIKSWSQMLYKYPALNLERVDYDAYWQDKRGKAIGGLSDWQEIRASIILDIIRKRDKMPASFVDIGCGDGSILKFIKDKITVSKLYGVDVSQFALQKAKEFGVEPIQTDITLPETVKVLPSCDYILMLEILEHIPESEIFLKGMYNHAQKGVFFSFPNTGFIVHRLRLLFGKFPLQWRLHPGEHLRYWTNSDLKWWLKSQGYDNATIHYYKGVGGLNKLWPSLFAAAFVVDLPKKIL